MSTWGTNPYANNYAYSTQQQRQPQTYRSWPQSGGLATAGSGTEATTTPRSHGVDGATIQRPPYYYPQWGYPNQQQYNGGYSYPSHDYAATGYESQPRTRRSGDTVQVGTENLPPIQFGGSKRRTKRQARLPEGQWPKLCDVCNVQLNSPVQHEAHMSGKKHKKNVAKAHQISVASAGRIAIGPPQPMGPYGGTYPLAPAPKPTTGQTAAPAVAAAAATQNQTPADESKTNGQEQPQQTQPSQSSDAAPVDGETAVQPQQQQNGGNGQGGQEAGKDDAADGTTTGQQQQQQQPPMIGPQEQPQAQSAVAATGIMDSEMMGGGGPGEANGGMVQHVVEVDGIKRCILCNVDLTSAVCEFSHLQGRRHQSALANRGFISKSGVPRRGGGRDLGRCDLCNVDFTSETQRDSHLAGRRHKRNMHPYDQMQGQPPRKRHRPNGYDSYYNYRGYGGPPPPTHHPHPPPHPQAMQPPPRQMDAPVYDQQNQLPPRQLLKHEQLQQEAEHLYAVYTDAVHMDPNNAGAHYSNYQQKYDEYIRAYRVYADEFSQQQQQAGADSTADTADGAKNQTTDEDQTMSDPAKENAEQVPTENGGVNGKEQPPPSQENGTNDDEDAVMTDVQEQNQPQGAVGDATETAEQKTTENVGGEEKKEDTTSEATADPMQIDDANDDKMMTEIVSDDGDVASAVESKEDAETETETEVENETKDESAVVENEDPATTATSSDVVMEDKIDGVESSDVNAADKDKPLQNEAVQSIDEAAKSEVAADKVVEPVVAVEQQTQRKEMSPAAETGTDGTEDVE